MYFFKIVYYELFFEHEYFEYLEYIFNRHFHFYIKIKASVFYLTVKVTVPFFLVLVGCNWDSFVVIPS